MTNSPFATSQPFTISSGPTSRSWVGHQRFWRMGVLHSRWSVRKLTSDCFAFGVVARARPTGMLTRPKEIDPFQIVRMGPLQGILVGSAPFAVFGRVSCLGRHGAGLRSERGNHDGRPSYTNHRAALAGRRRAPPRRGRLPGREGRRMEAGHVG